MTLQSAGRGNWQITDIELLPPLHSFDAFADIFESFSAYFEEVMYSFPNALCISFGAEEGDLSGQARDIGGELEESGGECFG